MGDKKTIAEIMVESLTKYYNEDLKKYIPDNLKIPRFQNTMMTKKLPKVGTKLKIT